MAGEVPWAREDFRSRKPSLLSCRARAARACADGDDPRRGGGTRRDADALLTATLFGSRGERHPGTSEDGKPQGFGSQRAEGAEGRPRRQRAWTPPIKAAAD